MTPARHCEECSALMGDRRSPRCASCAARRRRARTKEASRRHYLRNREAVWANRRAWEFAHPAEARAARRRRAMRRRMHLAATRGHPGSGPPPATYDPLHIYERDGWRCRLCGGLVDPTTSPNRAGAPTVDHVIPVSRGGSDTPDNVQLAHRGCNARKGASTPATTSGGTTDEPRHG